MGWDEALDDLDQEEVETEKNLSTAERLFAAAATRTLSIDVLGVGIECYWPDQPTKQRIATVLGEAMALHESNDSEAIAAADKRLTKEVFDLVELVTVEDDMDHATLAVDPNGLELAGMILGTLLRDIKNGTAAVAGFRKDTARKRSRKPAPAARKNSK